MNEQLIGQAHRILTRCGAVRSVPGGSIVPLVKTYLFPMTLNSGTTQGFEKLIDGDYDFELSSLQCDQSMTGILFARIQIQLPSGRLLFGGNGIDIGQLAYVGASALAVNPPEPCPVGSKILVTLTDYGIKTSSISPTICFDGVELCRFSGAAACPPSANLIPRIRNTINQNLLAPCWQAGAGIATPDDEYIVYSTPGQPDQAYTTLTIGGTVSATAQLTIDNGYTFRCHRMIFEVYADAAVTGGAIMGRVRTGTGQIKTDGFIDLARYLNGLEFPKQWEIEQGDTVYFDVTMQDTSGTGNMYFQAHLEGYRRRIR